MCADNGEGRGSDTKFGYIINAWTFVERARKIFYGINVSCCLLPQTQECLIAIGFRQESVDDREENRLSGGYNAFITRNSAPKSSSKKPYVVELPLATVLAVRIEIGIDRRWNREYPLPPPCAKFAICRSVCLDRNNRASACSSVALSRNYFCCTSVPRLKRVKAATNPMNNFLPLFRIYPPLSMGEPKAVSIQIA